MKVSELVQLLQGMDQNALVICSIDPEGNGFQKVSGADSGLFVEDDWEYMKHPKDLDSELIEQGYSEEDCGDPEKHVGCVCIWP